MVGYFQVQKLLPIGLNLSFEEKFFTNHQEHLESINFTTTVVFTISHIATPYGMQVIITIN